MATVIVPCSSRPIWGDGPAAGDLGRAAGRARTRNSSSGTVAIVNTDILLATAGNESPVFNLSRIKPSFGLYTGCKNPEAPLDQRDALETQAGMSDFGG